MQYVISFSLEFEFLLASLIRLILTNSSYYEKAQTEFKPPLLASSNVFLGDIFSSQKLDAEKPISCGLYRLEKGEPLVYTYAYHEMKIIIEGEFQITDETGRSVTARPGDVFHFGKGTDVSSENPTNCCVEKGAVITFTTPSYGLAFYTGQRPEGAA